MSDNHSRPYESGKPNEGCQACAWGRGEHSLECLNRRAPAVSHSPGDWICTECCEKDPMFRDAEHREVSLVLDSGDCERCERVNVALYRLRGTVHGCRI